MTYEIRALNFHDKTEDVTIDRFPDYCPYCHRFLKPILLGSYLNSDDSYIRFLQLTFRCTNNDCRRVFIANYTYHSYYDKHNVNTLREILPYIPNEPEIPDSVKDISPAFCRIYIQAKAADEQGLSEICGMGYRKALEFLIKDFIINRADQLDISDTNNIAKQGLSACINNYIKDPDTIEAAKRTIWLGNDETHYYRQWENKDITDLKQLLEIPIALIDHRLKLEKYLADMKKK